MRRDFHVGRLEQFTGDLAAAGQHVVAPVHHLRRRNVAVLLNGALAGSVPAAGSIIVSANPLRIGGNSIWGEYFNGRIDEVRIYNRALTAAEIVNDMNAAIVP